MWGSGRPGWASSSGTPGRFPSIYRLSSTCISNYSTFVSWTEDPPPRDRMCPPGGGGAGVQGTGQLVQQWGQGQGPGGKCSEASVLGWGLGEGVGGGRPALQRWRCSGRAAEGPFPRQCRLGSDKGWRIPRSVPCSPSPQEGCVDGQPHGTGGPPSEDTFPLKHTGVPGEREQSKVKTE